MRSDSEKTSTCKLLPLCACKNGPRQCLLAGCWLTAAPRCQAGRGAEGDPVDARDAAALRIRLVGAPGPAPAQRPGLADQPGVRRCCRLCLGLGTTRSTRTACSSRRLRSADLHQAHALPGHRL